MRDYLEKGKRGLLAFLAMLLLTLLACPGIQAEDEAAKQRIAIDGAGISGKHLPQAEEYEPIVTYSMESSGWAYGSQLEGNQLQIYHTLANTTNMLAVNSQNMLVVKLENPYSVLNSLAYDTAMKDIVRAVHAFIEDYGEYYWINAMDGWIQSDGVNYLAYSQVWLMPVDYYSGIRSEISATNAELQKAVNAVKAKTGTYEKVLAAHDYVAELVEYNTGDTNAEYGHTITGGLLAKYQHKAVCECYAKLFKLLCNANNIPCILISGGSSYDSSGRVVADHMWNYVQMDDGLWYLVDVTWDDEMGGYDYFLAGSSTSAYGGGTVSADHIPVGRFSDAVMYKEFVVPKLSVYSYGDAYGVELPLQQISLKEAAFSIDVEQGKYVSVAQVSPLYANVDTCLTYTSSNTAVATVNANGFVKGKSAGTAVITVSSKNKPSIKAACTVTVRNHVFDSGTLVKEPTTASTGKMLYTCRHGCGKTQEKTIPKAYVRLNASVLPLQVKKTTKVLKVTDIGSQDCVVKWSSSNKKIAAVNSTTGKITAKKTGTAKITVKTKFGATATCKIKVQKSTVKTKKLSLTKKAVTIKKGNTYTVKAVRNPLTATDKLMFATSNKKVAAVSSKGKITAKKKGRATITVKSASGKKAKLTVKVS